mgnify:CR=1 FL=1
MKECRHYLNGQYVTESKLLVSPRDLGFSRSFAVFDYLRTYNGGPFKLKEYLKRLLRSAELIDLKHNYSLEDLTKIVEEALDKNNDGNEKTVKIILSGGISNFMYQSGKPTLIVMVDSLKLKDKKIYEDGVKVNLVKFVRYIPEAKSTNYIEEVRRAQADMGNGAYERVYFSDKQVHEGATSNIFAIKNKKIYTPKNNILFGITRGVLLKDLNSKLHIVEKDFDLKFLINADEVFITSSGKKIVPVVKVDKNIIGNGRVGEITKQVMKNFEEFTRKSNTIK